MGLVVFLVLGLFVRDDLTFDRFHEHTNQIYRMITHNYKGGIKSETYSITAGLAALLISLVTISFQTIRAARTDPAAVLRQE